MKLYKVFSNRFLRVESEAEVQRLLATGKYSTEKNAPPTPVKPKVEPIVKAGTEQGQGKTPPRLPGELSKERCGRLYRHAKKIGKLDRDAVHRLLAERYGLETSKKLSREQYSEIMRHITSLAPKVEEASIV